MSASNPQPLVAHYCICENPLQQDSLTVAWGPKRGNVFVEWTQRTDEETVEAINTMFYIVCSEEFTNDIGYNIQRKMKAATRAGEAIDYPNLLKESVEKIMDRGSLRAFGTYPVLEETVSTQKEVLEFTQSIADVWGYSNLITPSFSQAWVLSLDKRGTSGRSEDARGTIRQEHGVTLMCNLQKILSGQSYVYKLNCGLLPDDEAENIETSRALSNFGNYWKALQEDTTSNGRNRAINRRHVTEQLEECYGHVSSSTHLNSDVESLSLPPALEDALLKSLHSKNWLRTMSLMAMRYEMDDLKEPDGSRSRRQLTMRTMTFHPLPSIP